MIFKARQTVGQGGSPTIDQNFKDLESVVGDLQDADPAPSVTSVSKDYAASVNDVHVFGSGTLTVTLADATKMRGRTVSVSARGGTVTVAASRGQTIDGAATEALTSPTGKTYASDGANWWGV